MSSLKPRSRPAKRARRAPAASTKPGDLLPVDVLFDVLVRLTARDLCRLRAVCRRWRSLTADPLFVRAHASRHPGPLLLAQFREDDAETHVLNVVDLSGNVVKRIRINADDDGRHHQLLLLPTRLDLACVATEETNSSCRVLDPATGVAYALPESPAPEHEDHENLRRPDTSYAFGRVPSTGEYKILRIFNRPEYYDVDKEQLFEVLTVDNAGCASASSCSSPRWRARQPRGTFVEATSAVVVTGAVYFKIDSAYHSMMIAGVNPGINQDTIFSFDLETEQWRRELRGPMDDNFVIENLDDFDDFRCFWTQLTLADHGGALALVHYRDHRALLDLWILDDFERGVWVKKFSVRTESRIPNHDYPLKSVFVMDDGRFLIHVEKTGSLIVYDPRLNTSVLVEMKHLDAVAMYTGNLLCLQADRDMV